MPQIQWCYCTQSREVWLYDRYLIFLQRVLIRKRAGLCANSKLLPYSSITFVNVKRGSHLFKNNIHSTSTTQRCDEIENKCRVKQMNRMVAGERQGAERQRCQHKCYT